MQVGHAGVFGSIPQLNEINGYVFKRCPWLIICQEIRGGLPQLRLCGLFVEIVGHVQRHGPRVCHALRCHDALRKNDKHLDAVDVLQPVRHNGVICGARVDGLQHIGHILSIADRNARVLPSVSPQVDSKPVVFVFAAVDVKQAALAAAHDRAHAGGMVKGKRGERGLIGDKGKRVCVYRIGRDALQGCHNAHRFKWVQNDIRKPVGDVPRVERYKPVYRRGPLVNNKRFPLPVVVVGA